MSMGELEVKIRQFKQLQRTQEALEAELEAIKNEIKGEMTARNVEEITAGEYKVRWVEVKNSQLDTKALRAALPEVVARFTVERVTKRFTVV